MTARDNLPDVIRQGLALQQQGQLAEAEACYRKILEIDRHHVDANHLLGVLKAQEGRTEEALGFIEAAAGAAPNATLILMNYGNILSEVGRHQEALSRFDRALAIDPQLSSVWSNRGNTLNRLKRYDEAVASHERAIDLSPNDADALYNLGLSLHRQGHYDRANAHFDRALELRPGFIKARRSPLCWRVARLVHRRVGNRPPTLCLPRTAASPGTCRRSKSARICQCHRRHPAFLLALPRAKRS